MVRFGRLLATALALSGMLSTPAQAYEQQLTTEEIREAFLLGSRNDERTIQFLGRYQQLFPPSLNAELHVGEVQIVTPYSHIVFAAQHDTANENAVDAVQHYDHRSLPFLVRVWIFFPSDLHIGTDRYEHAKRSSVIVSQAYIVKPSTKAYHPVYTGGRYSRLVGVEVEEQFETAQVASDNLKIHVIFPDGRHFQTTFDLARLR
jgi:hypothetical protein